MTNAAYYAFGIGCMRLTQISHLLNELSIGNAVGKSIDLARLFLEDPKCLIGSPSPLFNAFVRNECDSRPGGVLS
jgi:hypothetical protein